MPLIVQLVSVALPERFSPPQQHGGSCRDWRSGADNRPFDAATGEAGPFIVRDGQRVSVAVPRLYRPPPDLVPNGLASGAALPLMVQPVMNNVSLFVTPPDAFPLTRVSVSVIVPPTFQRPPKVLLSRTVQPVMVTSQNYRGCS